MIGSGRENTLKGEIGRQGLYSQLALKGGKEALMPVVKLSKSLQSKSNQRKFGIQDGVYNVS